MGQLLLLDKGWLTSRRISLGPKRCRVAKRLGGRRPPPLHLPVVRTAIRTHRIAPPAWGETSHPMLAPPLSETDTPCGHTSSLHVVCGSAPRICTLEARLSRRRVAGAGPIAFHAIVAMQNTLGGDCLPQVVRLRFLRRDVAIARRTPRSRGKQRPPLHLVACSN